MNPEPKINPSAIRRDRLNRKRSIRRRALSGAVALFVAAWLLIAVVLISGHDPALAARKSPAAATTSTSTAAQTTGTAAQTTSTPAQTTSTQTTTTQSSGNSGGATSSVTTSQS